MAIEIAIGYVTINRIIQCCKYIGNIWYERVLLHTGLLFIDQYIYLCQCSRTCNNGKNVLTMTWKQPHTHIHTIIIHIPIQCSSIETFFFSFPSHSLTYNLYSSSQKIKFRNELWWLFDRFVNLFSLL